MKVRASIRSLAKQPGAQVVRRRGKVFVINKQNPRFKGRQGLRAAPVDNANENRSRSPAKG